MISQEINPDFIIKDSVLIRYSGCEKTVVVPDGVTSIARGAFQGRDTIEYIVIPNSVNVLRNGAFAECANLKAFTFRGITINV